MISGAVLAGAIQMAVPILLCATGALLNDRAGTTNISMEGAMLISAFFAVAGSYYTSSWAAGLIAGVLVSVLLSLVFFLITQVLGGDELIVGLSLSILMSGLTEFLLRQMFGRAGSLFSDRIQGIPKIQSEAFAAVPVLGPLLNGNTWIVYFAYIALYLAYLLIYRSPFGLKILASGEKPDAAATVGINVVLVRFICNLICGVLCGLAGVQLSIGYLTLFTEGMTVGRGFIALGAVMFCQGKPLRLLGITLFFGLAQSLSNQMQLFQLPSELVLVIPYIAVILLTLFHLDKKKANSLSG
nr:ABC transporter permease [uncultured Oscillibacter sp.]